MAESQSFIDNLTAIIGVLSPIAVALLAVVVQRRANNDKQYRDLREQNENLEKESRIKKEKEAQEQIKEISDNVKNLSDEVESLRSDFDIEKISEQLGTLKSLNTVNFDYIQSLSGVVTTLGEEMMHSSTNSANLQKSINSHRETEKSIVGKLLKIMY